MDENETLLVAAASGAATNVGRWLIETQGFPVEHIKNNDPYYSHYGRSPLQALMRFMGETGSPRTKSFSMLLKKHGINLDALDQNKKTPLQEAISDQRNDIARLLIEAGANTALLNKDEQQALKILLAEKNNEYLIEEKSCSKA
ncbi:ankyrin repeat domain-containing protein [Photorhabdus cinerea]|uniref:Ankyrin repeat domain-containing protein n=1 Tax=Photorhabdus cinerea TaxID=471575 RepID=A0A7X5TIX5_9GAMM|nr:ankyrin repeat domain-containing protein [Photorhabdus cinerea]NHB94385.1 hypothetical protein [Photorhabdus cinerea]